MAYVATDPEQIRVFTHALFRYASAGTFVSLRAFDDQEKGKPPFALEAVQINGSGLAPVIEQAKALAERCANAAQAIVFCPPVVTFLNADNAKSENVAEGVAVSVDCDTTPIAARERLESLLGPATVVTASGGTWTDPETGELQDKLHLHWRLAKPTLTIEDHRILKETRALATKLVGGDETNTPLVHPIRWPGTVHRKSKPRLARIISLNEDVEIDLHQALAFLQDATADRPLSQRARQVCLADGVGLTTGWRSKTSDEYRSLFSKMKTDGYKHEGVRDIAASMAAQGCSRPFVEAFIREYCPVYDRNVQNSIDSAFRKYAPPTSASDPVDLWGSFDPPELPKGLLPKIIEDFAENNSSHMGADPAGLAVAALVTCAAAISDELQLKVKRNGGWAESPRLWAALVGAPSTKKSPIISIATGPLCSLDVQMMRAWQKAVIEFDELPKDERKGKHRPPQTRLRIEDATVEAAQQVLEGSPWGVLLLQDELSGFFGAMDKYNGGKGAQADRAFWLRSFNGGQFALNRVGRGATIIENLSVSMLGGIQPEPLRKIAGASVDDGLLQRIFPIMLRSATVGLDEPMPRANSCYSDLISGLQRLSPACFDGDGYLEFDDGAQVIRRELEARHLELQSLETINCKLASHLGKYDGLFARLCAVWHCIEAIEASGGDNTGLALIYNKASAVVSEDTAQRVARFLHDFLFPHALAFYTGVLGLSDDHDRLTAIAGYILTHKLEKITNRDVQRGTRDMRNLQEHQIRSYFEQLSALGWLDRMDPPRPSSSPHWRVNPTVHEKFSDRAAREAQRREAVRTTISALNRKQA